MLAAHGFGGLTLRAVAAELGATTGLLTHYFPSKEALVRHALEIAEEHTQNRPRHDAQSPGLAALRAALLDVLPLSAETTEMNKVWVSFWAAAVADPELRSFEAARYERWRMRLHPHAADAIRLGQLSPGANAADIVATAASFAHGLVVQALIDPARFPPARQEALVDQFIDSLRRGQG